MSDSELSGECATSEVTRETPSSASISSPSSAVSPPENAASAATSPLKHGESIAEEEEEASLESPTSKQEDLFPATPLVRRIVPCFQ